MNNVNKILTDIVNKILTDIKELDSHFIDKIQKLEPYIDTYNRETPSFLRNLYDEKTATIEVQLSILNETKNNLNEIIIIVNESIKKINYLQKLYGKIQIIFNMGKVGTLEGLLRENIQNGNIPINRKQKKKLKILNQPYDEFKEVSATGGFTKKTRAKYTRKHKKYKKYKTKKNKR